MRLKKMAQEWGDMVFAAGFGFWLCLAMVAAYHILR